MLVIALSHVTGAYAESSEKEESAPQEEVKRIYRTVDEFGNVIFTDERVPGAIEVRVRESNTVPGTAPADLNAPIPDQEEDAPFVRYRTLAVTSPGNEEAVRANNGDITISVNILPAPQDEHLIELLMDGGVVGEVDGTTGVSLQNVDRGEHVARLRVKDRRTGRVLQTGPSRTFYVLRASRLN